MSRQGRSLLDLEERRVNAAEDGATTGQGRYYTPAGNSDGWISWSTIFSLLTLTALGIAIAGLVVALTHNGHNDDDDGLDPYSCKSYLVNDVVFLKQADVANNKAWPSWSRDYSASRFNPHIYRFDKDNLDDIEGPFIYTTDTNSGVSATIVIDEAGVAYFPDRGTEDLVDGGTEDAKLYAVDLSTITTVWKKDVADYAADPATYVRVSLTEYTNSTGGANLVFCDQGTPNLTCVADPALNVTADPACGAYCYGVEKSTAELLWSTQVSDQGSAIVTSSPNVVGQTAYFGLSSSESALAANPFYDCCNFVGHYYALDTNYGAVLFDEVTLEGDAAMNISGAAVWGSNPPYDPATDRVVFGTGNLYSLNDNLTSCLAEVGANPFTCALEGVNMDSVLAVSASNFERRWINKGQGVDAWNVACLFGGPNCPDPEGPDYDFGAGAVTYTDECGRKYVAAYAKSGILWCFDLVTGEVIWRTYVGTGATIINGWGIAFDGYKLYMSNANGNGRSYRTLDGTVRCDGYWAAVKAFTGELEWLTPAPNSRASGACPPIEADAALEHVLPQSVLTYSERGDGPVYNAEPVSDYPNPSPDPTRDTSTYSRGHGAVIVAADLMWGGAMNGYMYAFDKDSGKILEGLRCPEGSIYGSASIAQIGDDETEYLTFGCGYGRPGFGGLPGNKVMIYKLD